MPRGEYASLLEHMEWADAAIWRVALALERAPQDAGLRERLHHLHTVQRIYLQMWRGEPMEPRALESFADLGALAAWAKAGHSELRPFAAGLERERLARHVEFPWAGEVAKRLGSAGPATLGESILQVVLHSAYHRGQVATVLRKLGGEPPLTDFIAWLWRERPAAEWPEVRSDAGTEHGRD